MKEKIDIAAIGSDDTIILFNAVGIKTYMVKSSSEAEKTIAQLTNEKCRIIYLAEDIYEVIPETIEKYQYTPFPIIIPLPTKTVAKGVGLKKIKDNVEKAIGINIF
ncbi:MAG: V-type ATP synthase subunit F [Bacilli bacterium]|nr:V-type ATP synthase subunit F [Bacilli bacterium]MDD4076658.1 V-type ATP synthase subunit F [Bacilli bacterium]